MRVDGTWRKGSWLTTTLRDQAMSDDNRLGGIAKVPFDRVAGYGDVLPGLGAKTHRVHTFGHDPLLGLVSGTLDIMKGTMTGVSKTGQVTSVPVAPPLTSNPFEALAIEVMHLLSDAPTQMGLPLPGWTALMTAPVGNLGGKAINEHARQMYLRGYDSWHFLTMATVQLTIHLVLRSYWYLRGQFDHGWARDVDHEAHVAASERTGDHPRFRALYLAAHGVAAADNIGKLIAYGGNPLALNYALWLSFLREFFPWVSQRQASPTDVLTDRAKANQLAIDDGWPALPDIDSDFPSLVLPEPRRKR